MEGRETATEKSQKPTTRDRPDNLSSTIAGDRDAHGAFDDRALTRRDQLWLNRRRILVVISVGGLAGLGLMAWKRKKPTRKLGIASAGDIPVVNSVFAQNRPEIVYAWRGPSLLVVDNQGSCGSRELSGFFFREARYLRDLRLEIQGEEPFPCSFAEVGPNELEFTFVYPEKKGGGSDRGGASHGVRFRDLDLRVRYQVRPSGLLATIWITNRWLDPITIDVAWVLSADFADMGEIYGDRQQQAEVETIVQTGAVHFRYSHPEIPMETHASAEGGATWSFADGRLATQVALERQSTVELRLNVLAIDVKDPMDGPQQERREERLDEWFRNITFIEAPGETPLVEITNRSMRELGSMALLEGQQDEWLTPAAGLPVFPDLWGRDALTASWQATVFDHGEMAESILSRLGRLQGKQMDPWRDEQPGRIIRAAQRGPLTRLGKTPFDRYYGDFASPFAFILALGQLYAWSGDKRLLGKHWDVARRIIDWARHYGDRDGDGYLEYMTQSKAGPTHQGWRDSENGMVYEDGRQVSPPIASCEIQGYYFAAQQFMAVLSLAMGEVESAQAFWTSAREFKACFNRDFWMDDQDCVALGLDPDKRKIKSVTSNAGQCLATGVVDDEKLPRLVRRLFAADMFSGWGIRTLSSDHPSYNPLGYHLGSVWAVENGTILLGLRRFGFTDESVRLARALYDQALLWRGHRIPECVGGYSRDESVYPGAFPQASVPQTWNLSIFPLLVQCLLGLEGLASLKLLAVDPILPAWLPDVTVRRLRVGDATVSLRFYRDERGDSHYEVLEKAGTLHVVRQPPIDSLSTSVLERLGALVRR